jgi:hypothetical protein
VTEHTSVSKSAISLLDMKNLWHLGCNAMGLQRLSPPPVRFRLKPDSLLDAEDCLSLQGIDNERR